MFSIQHTKDPYNLTKDELTKDPKAGNNWINISSRKVYKLPIGTWKDAHH